MKKENKPRMPAEWRAAFRFMADKPLSVRELVKQPLDVQAIVIHIDKAVSEYFTKRGRLCYPRD